MSNDSDMLVWVGDLDAHVNLDAINRANESEAQEEALLAELGEIGAISLLAGKATSAHSLNRMGVAPSEWRWAMHQAERSLSNSPDPAHLERDLVKALISLGRPYAVARYAKWEQISHAAAVVASQPYGIKALLIEYLHGIGLQRTKEIGSGVTEALRGAAATTDLVAYERVRHLRSAIDPLLNCDIVLKAAGSDEVPFRGRPRKIEPDPGGMRRILALSRLHFSATEINVSSFEALRDLNARYEIARNEARVGELKPWSSPTRGFRVRNIRNWQLRHLRPLVDLYPYSIRHALARGSIRGSLTAGDGRALAINELALSHCGILLMRRAGRDASRSK